MTTKHLPTLLAAALVCMAPGTSGDSSISTTVILTGSDATFANALALAVPEPSTALLGGLGLLALLRLSAGVDPICSCPP